MAFTRLATVYQTLELHDLVTVTARPAAATVLRLTSNDSRVPTDERNTAWKMVVLALEALGLAAEVEIHIDKRLPVQGGLGAGSANAVAALVGLENGIGIAELGRQGGKSASQRVSPGQRGGWRLPPSWLGCAAFLIGGAVLGSDRGQKVEPLPDFEPLWCVVAMPEVGVSTPQAFRDWDALCVEEGLTAEASTDKLNKLSRAYASAFAGEIPEGRQELAPPVFFQIGENLAGPLESALVRTGIFSWIANDFERVVFPQHPSLAEIKRILAASAPRRRALHASLSGSGSALFGLYLTREDAEAARERLQRWRCEESVDPHSAA